MLNSIRISLIPAIVAVILVGSVAAAPAAPAKPNTPTAAATADAGELQVSWDSAAGAQFYTVGWINRNDYIEIGSSGDWLSAFHYATIPASRTSYDISGLKTGEEYWTIVGARTSRSGGEAPVWSSWSTLATTAGQHGEGFCPITGLPLPPSGYLSVGERTTSLYSHAFTLTGVTRKQSVSLSNKTFNAVDGQQFIKVCGTYHASNTSTVNTSFWDGSDYQVDTDAGIGFSWPDNDVTPWRQVPPGRSRAGCQTWGVPKTATTVIVAVSNWTAGEQSASTSLFKVDLP